MIRPFWQQASLPVEVRSGQRGSKDQFGMELLKHYVADASAYKRRTLQASEPEPNPLRADRLRAVN
jgi:hypothetical protein